MTDPSETSSSETNKALFVNLVMMFSTSALQCLGQMPDPSTQEAKVDLEGAQTNIDLLDMLEEKTRGNLDDDESRMLKEALSSLKMAYVHVRGAEASPPEPSPEAPPQEPVEPGKPTADEGGIVSGEATETKEPKFHKKYD